MDGPAFVFLEKLACKMQIVEFCFEVRNYLLYDFKIKTSKIKGNGSGSNGMLLEKNATDSMLRCKI